MKILLIFRFFHWFIDIENLFYYFERKNDKVVKFNTVHFPNFEISTAPNSFKI